ncbi:hypothetical protein KLP40_07310 [Hymenobacter sp. NST-14]|uniref:hypothetical protein n=1 Tax=Hymenobacter piscis TaxID=2839984 RepID=UPI001C024DB6|nr:hypothetical protein [Hymenobacter piscis]MBT9392965.1 hypothetical protein [Hymenobacter piscis]
MFYSHSVEASKFDLFTSLLSTLLKGKYEYKNFVDAIFEETHNYANGRKNIYNINKENAPIVVFLNQNDSEFFKEIEVNQIKHQDYEHVYQLLNKSISKEWIGAF